MKNKLMVHKGLIIFLSAIFAIMKDNIETSTNAEKIASALLKVEAVKLNLQKPFIWSSGWNSPIYCDNRITLSYPELRSTIKQHLTAVVKEHYPEADAIAGVATAGIPQGALIADALNLPYLYVRSKSKGHGMENLIEGKLTASSKIVLVEDLISTGGSSLKAAEAIRNAGGKVLGIIAIFTYGLPHAAENFEKADIKGVALSDYDHLIASAANQGLIKKEQIEILQSWRKDPANWLK
jgi:orotate phosphoribosyltransferase